MRFSVIIHTWKKPTSLPSTPTLRKQGWNVWRVETSFRREPSTEPAESLPKISRRSGTCATSTAISLDVPDVGQVSDLP